MKKFTRLSLITGIAFLVYGYLARMLSIYFFWDSKIFGWLFLLLALIGFLFGLVQLRRKQGKKTIWPKLGAGFLLFGLAISPFIIFMMKNSEAYDEAIEFLKTDSQIKKEMGDIKGFGLIPTGSVSNVTVNGLTSGDAEFHLTIRGTKKYKDITIVLTKTPETFWKVVSVE